jgi:Spy/CpxP family protein refolding chaperone
MNTHAAIALLLCSLAAAAPPAGAEAPGRPTRGMRGGPPAFLRDLYPPALVMRHQEEIDLTEAQREAITRAMAETQTKLIDLRWRSEAESEKLAKMLRGDAVDEAAALAQSARVIAAEQEIKQAHVALLIRIKGELTPAQERRLRALRRKARGPGGADETP